jgi:hypothetical protein
MAAIDWEGAITVLSAGPDREVVAVDVAFSNDGGHGFRRAGAGGQDPATGPDLADADGRLRGEQDLRADGERLATALLDQTIVNSGVVCG